VYARTLAPTITWAHDSADGGDLITAVYTQGVPHPTGYPTYLILGGLFAAVAPGDAAYRLNLLSAVCTALAVVLVTWAATRLVQPLLSVGALAQLAGSAAGLAFAFSPVLWSQAVVAEVYALNMAVFAALLLFLTSPAVSPILMGLVWGLGLGNHLTLALAFPLVAVATARPTAQRWAGRRAWLGTGAGILLGLSVYLVLPVRASAGPPINWGDASTLNGFWWLVSGQLYQGYVFGLPLADWPARLSAWAALLGAQLTWLGLALGLAGLAWLNRHDKPLALAGSLTFALVSVFALGYNTTDSYILLLPASALLALWGAVGWARLLARLERRGSAAARGAAIFGFVLPSLLLVGGYAAADASSDTSAAAFGQQVLISAPPQAIVVSRSDPYSSALWYTHYVEGIRPDVAVVDADLLEYPWYTEALLRHEHELRSEELPGRRSEAASSRPLCEVEGAAEAWRLDCSAAATEWIVGALEPLSRLPGK
jgi:hypothetical protein